MTEIPGPDDVMQRALRRARSTPLPTKTKPLTSGSGDAVEDVGKIDAVGDEAADSSKSGKPKQANLLIELAQDAHLFHTSDGVAYADIRKGNHRETWNVRSRGFKRHLALRFFSETGGAPSSEALQASLNMIEARAHFDGPLREIFVRVGGLDGKIYIDLVDDTWRAVEITAGGWSVITDPPVRFRRAAGMKPLPLPISGGSIELLRPFLNVAHDEDFVLSVAWLLACFRYHGPFPVLLVNGEQGSAKSTFCALVRLLIDPNSAPLRALPREDRDLFIAATNGHVLCFDNVSGMQPWIADTLCRLATGGGFAARALYSDGDEALFDASRPTILNGIDSVITRPDLADRALFLTLNPIADADRRSERDLMVEFEGVRPLIIGALLDGVVRGLRDIEKIQLDRLPRMADFAKWAAACETAFWAAGTFAAAYSDNRADIVSDVLEADPVAAAMIAYMADRKDEVTQTASFLLGALGEIISTQQRKAKNWPDTPRAFSNRLHRAAPFLRKAGIGIEFLGRKKSARQIRLWNDPDYGGDAASPSSPSSPAETR